MKAIVFIKEIKKKVIEVLEKISIFVYDDVVVVVDYNIIVDSIYA